MKGRIDRRRTKNWLSLRVLQSQTRWLSGLPVWDADAGRVSLQFDGKSIVPDGKLISQTQRRLNKSLEFRSEAIRIMPEFDEWRAEQLFLLERAKHLASISAAKANDRKSSKLTMADVDMTVSLLVAEAVCINEMPFSPARDLLMRDCFPLAAVAGMIPLKELSLQAKSFIAIVLGAYDARKARSSAEWTALLSKMELDRHAHDYLSRSYKWGRSNGIPQSPVLTTTLLSYSDGINLIAKTADLLKKTSIFELPTETIRTMFVEHEPHMVLATLEVVAEMTDIASAALDSRAVVKGVLENEPRSSRRRQSDPSLLHRSVLGVAETGACLGVPALGLSWEAMF